MTRLIVIRPEPGNAATVAEARSMGLNVAGFPLFEVVPLAWQEADPDSYDALLLGSANALRHAGTGLAALRGLPAYVVGATTARAAEAAGLRIAGIGSGGLQSMLDQVAPEHRRLLRLCGRERTALSPSSGITIDERIVYASEPRSMPSALAQLLRRGAVVLLHSGEAAQHFAAQCDVSGVDRTGVVLAALGPRIATAAGEGWKAVRSAAEPRDRALLALAREMCQDCAQPRTRQDGPDAG